MDEHLVIEIADAPSGAACALCGRPAAAAGPRLARVGGREAVCRECGRRQAPALGALLELGDVARQLGHVSRPTWFRLPLASLLDLVHASEAYADTTTTAGRRLA